MKRKILAIVIACAMLFMGMGYAFWTDSLQIDTLASTGKLCVKFVDAALYGSYWNVDETNEWTIYTGIPGSEFVPNEFFDRAVNEWDPGKKPTFNIIGDPAALTAYRASVAKYTQTDFDLALQDPTIIVPDSADDTYGTPGDGSPWIGTAASDGIDVTMFKMYPGYAQLFRTDILNLGTIAAKLADICVEFNEIYPPGFITTEETKDMIGISLKVLNESNLSIKVLEADDPADVFEVGGLEFIRLSALEDGDFTIVNGPAGDLLFLYPDPDNTMDVIYGIAMDPDYEGDYTTGHIATGGAISPDNDDWDSERKFVNFSIKFLWDQFNTVENYGLPVAE